MTAPIRTRTPPPVPDELTIEITAEDICGGERGHSRLCPIGLALTRAGYQTPSVRAAAVRFVCEIPESPGRLGDYWYDTTDAVRRFITEFDERDGRVEPCTLTLTRHRGRGL